MNGEHEGCERPSQCLQDRAARAPWIRVGRACLRKAREGGRRVRQGPCAPTRSIKSSRLG
jgi:hypothetical protein